MNVIERIRTTAIAGTIAIAGLLGGTAAVVVAAPLPHISGGAAVAVVPATQFQGAQPATMFQGAQLTNVFHGAAPGPTYNGIQLANAFHGAAPGPAFED